LFRFDGHFTVGFIERLCGAPHIVHRILERFTRGEASRLLAEELSVLPDAALPGIEPGKELFLALGKLRLRRRRIEVHFLFSLNDFGEFLAGAPGHCESLLGLLRSGDLLRNLLCSLRQLLCCPLLGGSGLLGIRCTRPLLGQLRGPLKSSGGIWREAGSLPC
jgi:hypothetical protein